MLRYSIVFLALSLIVAPCAHANIGSEANWSVSLQTTGETWIGARPGCADGYDGQTPSEVSGSIGLNLYLYRESGPTWAGPTGFYGGDFESPIPPGGSKTWSNLYIWTGNPSFSPRAYLTILPDGPLPPSGYWAQLVLDYVPESLGWTGPWTYAVTLDRRSIVEVPVPLVSDGLQGVRMHLTVTAPVPEPSSLAALGLALVGLWGGYLRRRG